MSTSLSPIRIQQAAAEPFFKNGYVLACAGSKHAACIDPGDEAPALLKFIEENELELICILLTHAHLDHICGVSTVRENWNIPIYLHQEDAFLYRMLEEQAQWFGLKYPAPPAVDYYLHPSKQISVGDLSIRVLHTPGHSPGSVSLQVERHLFCGDVLFAGSIGRTDLPGASHEVLMKTLRERILPLGDPVILHPGHGPETTIGRERESNPFLAGLRGV